MAGTRRALLTVTVLAVVTGQFLPEPCRDCSLGGCLSVPRAEGGCAACICNGLLMPDCSVLNCTLSCSLELQLDGCSTCVCPVQNPSANNPGTNLQNNNGNQDEALCPPIPACPSRCQVQLGNGCPRCTCPEELGPQCPAVTCPQSCTDVTGPDGCPACDCPPQDRICPQMPACPLGCIGMSNNPELERCLSCNCTLAEDLVKENQILPDENTPLADPNINTDVELITTVAVDSGLVDPTEPNLNPDTNNILPNEVDPNVPTVADVNFLEPELPNPPQNPVVVEQPQTPTLPNQSQNPLNPVVPDQPQNNVNNVRPSSSLPNPFAPNNADPNRNVNIPVASRRGPNGRPNNGRRPTLNIPCGETSCPPGCSLCIQSNSCGRCLCGNLARVCPPVPACRPSCITEGPNGCFTCGCPAPSAGVPQQVFGGPPLGFGGIPFPGDFIPQPGPNGQFGPMVFSFNLGGSEEVGSIDQLFGPIIRRPSRRPFPGRRGNGRPTPGQIAVQNIPPGLLGISRFQIFE